MLVITVELHPRGNVAHRRVIGTLVITNDLTGTQESGNYRYVLTKDNVTKATGIIENFPRQDKDAWELIRTILDSYSS